MRQIELLIPARDRDTGMAGVDFGADAVYIGGPAFGARAGAGNPVGDIARLVDYARPYGVKVYAALNTLVFEDELSQARSVAADLLSAGVDALIIQDPAYLMMGLEGAVFHASTQMCNKTAEGVEFLARSRFSRVVLERGLTLGQIREINRQTDVETECFVHGAICVGHSGRCYLSRSMGPRSGNRGQCSQPCRLRYDLTDGNGNTLVRGKHLLSVRDLNLSEAIGDLIDAGITSLKVEGRLKETDYVKNITAYYREAIDKEIAQRQGLRKSSDGQCRYDFTADPAKSFTRGFTTWTAGGMHRGVASFDTPKSLGEPLGRVARTGEGHFILDRPVEVSTGDGICFIAGGELAGCSVNGVEGERIIPDRMNGIKRGTAVFRNQDRKFSAALDRSRSRRSVGIDITCRLEGGGLAAAATDGHGNRAEVFLPGSEQTATDPARMLSTVEAQIKKSGDTIYSVERFVLAHSTGGPVPFFPVSAINGLRRELLDKLTLERLRYFSKIRALVAKKNVRDDGFPYPEDHLGGEGNVTNSLSEKFWRMHGVRSFDTAFDLRESLDGEVVMTTPYCLRREMGQCLKEKPEDGERALFLHHGSHRYRLQFDCRDCIMTLEKE